MKRISALVCCLGVLALVGCNGGAGSDTSPAPVVAVTPPSASVMAGQQIQLSATVSGGSETVTWSSSNNAVASVGSTGLVTARAPGQVTITATSGGGSGTAALTSTTGLLFTIVTAGSDHTCGVTLSGAAYCWGNNSAGQLGNGTTTNSATPVLVAGGLSFAWMSAGGQHTCGVTTFPSTQLAGGTVYCWGDNSFGQLGNGTTTNSATPVAITGGDIFVAVSAGANHSCGETPAGAAYCWGSNSAGQLGNGSTTNSATPVLVSPVLTGGFWSYVSAGNNHTCAVYQTGIPIGGGPVLCWGDNSAGQFGNGTTTSSTVPVNVMYGATFVSAGTLYTCSIFESTETCSGNNTFGQLGNGTTTTSLLPVAVVFPGTSFTGGGLSTGAQHACSLAQSNSLYCWGDNSSGQLGNGTTANSGTPVIVSGGLDFADVGAGGQHTCALTSSGVANSPTAGGAVYCWGDNSFGQLGNNWTTSSSVPINVAGPQ
jgi:alpha-tubulin suppressor-like RCC1 family protein